MSHELFAFLAPPEASSSARDIAGEVFAALETAGTYYVLVAPPKPDSAAWCLTVASTGDPFIDRHALRGRLVERAAFRVVTEIYHNDQIGHYGFEHRSERDVFRLGSSGPYLRGDLSRIVGDFPQHGYSNEELMELHFKNENDLTDRERTAITDYDNAVRLGLRACYPGGARYLDLLHLAKGWKRAPAWWDRSRVVETPLPADWFTCLTGGFERDHPAWDIDIWAERAMRRRRER